MTQKRCYRCRKRKPTEGGDYCLRCRKKILYERRGVRMRWRVRHFWRYLHL